MNASIITIGDEILIGQIIDTNSAWMAQQLNLLGIPVRKIITCSDGETDILSALSEASSISELILITGGLGPTKDDITKQALATYFGVDLEFSEETYQQIKFLINKYNLKMTTGLREQSYMPNNAQLLVNKMGSAPGMWFDFNDKVFVSMPGVPYEMKYLMKAEVLPRLKVQFDLPAIYHKTILTSGMGESGIADKLENIEASLPPNIKLAYLPGVAQVRLRLTGRGNDEIKLRESVESIAQEIIAKLGVEIVYGHGEGSLSEALLTLLNEKKIKLATAESCTGGLVGHLLTSIPGASNSYVGGIIAYSNRIKERRLGVRPETLKSHGAVSKETVFEMAKGVIKHFEANVGIAISGIAGPGGGTPDKPVGTTWIAVANETHYYTQKLTLEGNRILNIKYSANAALRAARQFILKQYGNETDESP